MARPMILPPIWLLIGLIAIFALNEFFPGPRFIGLAARVGGGAIILAGLVLLLLANGLFTRAGTDVVPFGNVTTLVTGGVYRVSRNPMYLGMVAVLLGCAVTVGSTLSLLVPLVFAVIIELRFIRPEEAMLRGLFPEEFPAYCRRVRRWV